MLLLLSWKPLLLSIIIKSKERASLSVTLRVDYTRSMVIVILTAISLISILLVSIMYIPTTQFDTLRYDIVLCFALNYGIHVCSHLLCLISF